MHKLHILNKLILILGVTVCQFGRADAQTIYTSSWGKDAPLTIGGLSALGVGFYLESKIEPMKPAEILQNSIAPKSIRWIDSRHINGRRKPQKPATGFVTQICWRRFCCSHPNGCKTTPDGMLMYLETLALSNGASLVIKSLVKRKRPFVYNEKVPMEEKLKIYARKSFYSGHATMGFVSATFFARTYQDFFPDSDWRAAVWGISMGSAGAVALLRVFAGKHYFQM
ncbi:MAG: phosphatase PAP2 family protein [Calditrichia bacterium]